MKVPRNQFLIVLSTLLGLTAISTRAADPAPSTPQSYLVYIGTFTTKQSKGIYLTRMDATTGALTAPSG